MLERASACIEPAVPILLRGFESPIRSCRVLGPSFWKNGVDELRVPAWWPLYLDSVRRVPQAGRHNDKTLGDRQQLTVFDSSQRFLRRKIKRDQPKSIRSQHKPPSRSFAVSAQRLATGNTAIQTIDDDNHPEEIQEDSSIVASSENPNSSVVEILHRENGDLNSVGSKGKREYDSRNYEAIFTTMDTPRPGREWAQGGAAYLQRILRAGPENEDIENEKYDRAWKAFITLPYQADFASAMLNYLSSSTKSTDLERALASYSMIPEEKRNKSDYEVAVAVALDRRKFQLASQISLEAVHRGLGQNCRQRLLIALLQNIRFKNAATVWQSLFLEPFATLPDAAAPKEAWSIIDTTDALPAMLSKLFRRLGKFDSVFSFEQELLSNMTKTLMYRVFVSPYIMQRITLHGIMQILDSAREFNMMTTGHFRRIFVTLRSMHKTRNRVDLALAIFRNFRFWYPDMQVPRSIFGSLIQMSVHAGHDQHTFEYLNKEFSTVHGKPDSMAYQRIMTGLARQGDVLGVKHQLNNYTRDFGSPKKLDFLTPLLNAYAQTGDAKNARAQFNRISDDYHMTPNTYCWNILMTAHARSANPETAFEVFDEMQLKDITPDRYSLGILMGVASNRGDIEIVHELLDHAKRLNIPVSYPLLDTLVHSYCLNGEIEDAEMLTESATRMKIEGSPVRMWNTLLRHYAFEAKTNAVTRIHNRMQELNIKPDEMTYAALMTSFVVLNETDAAARMLRAKHLDGSLTASSFHYAILLQGYAKEGKRDKANIIYNEMLRRFPKINMSAQLSRLHTQVRKSWSATIGPRAHIVHAKSLDAESMLDFFGSILSETSSANLAGKEPLPGFSRRSRRAALPSIFMELVVRQLALNSESGKALRLLERYDSLAHAEYMGVDNTVPQSIELLTTRLLVASQQGRWDLVDELWEKVLERGIEQGLSLQSRKNLSSVPSAPILGQSQEDSIFFDSKPRNVSTAPFKSLILETVDLHSQLKRDNLKILPAHRFTLAVPLNRYIQALDLQRRHFDIIQLVEKMQTIGFELSSKNWNNYVQVLCKASDPNHQMLAFKVFDDKFQSNMPPWKDMIRGKTIKQLPATGATLETDRLIPTKRKFWEALNPGRLMPTYFTLIYLGTVLHKFHEQATRGNSRNLDQLKHQSPLTVRIVRGIPYLRDRIQGLLLRSRPVQGDIFKIPQQTTMPARVGVLGSKSLLDQIPNHELLEFEKAVDMIKAEQSNQPSTLNNERNTKIISLMERIGGKVDRSSIYLPLQGRSENLEETKHRVNLEEYRILQRFEEARADLNRDQLMASDRFGDRPIGFVPPEHQKEDTLVRDDTTRPFAFVYNPQDTRLEKQAQSHAQALRGEDVLRVDSSDNSSVRRVPKTWVPYKSTRRTQRRDRYDTSILTRRIPKVGADLDRKRVSEKEPSRYTQVPQSNPGRVIPQQSSNAQGHFRSKGVEKRKHLATNENSLSPLKQRGSRSQDQKQHDEKTRKRADANVAAVIRLSSHWKR